MSWIGNGGKDIENTGNVNVEVKKMAGVDIRKEIISKTRIGKKRNAGNENNTSNKKNGYGEKCNLKTKLSAFTKRSSTTVYTNKRREMEMGGKGTGERRTEMDGKRTWERKFWF